MKYFQSTMKIFTGWLKKRHYPELDDNENAYDWAGYGDVICEAMAEYVDANHNDEHGAHINKLAVYADKAMQENVSLRKRVGKLEFQMREMLQMQASKLGVGNNPIVTKAVLIPTTAKIRSDWERKYRVHWYNAGKKGGGWDFKRCRRKATRRRNKLWDFSGPLRRKNYGRRSGDARE